MVGLGHFAITYQSLGNRKLSDFRLFFSDPGQTQFVQNQGNRNYMSASKNIKTRNTY